MSNYEFRIVCFQLRVYNDCICTVRVVRSLNLLTPTHAHSLLKTILKTPTRFGLRPSSGSYNILSKVTII
jgi:hypothetical protein